MAAPRAPRDATPPHSAEPRHPRHVHAAERDERTRLKPVEPRCMQDEQIAGLRHVPPVSHHAHPDADAERQEACRGPVTHGQGEWDGRARTYFTTITKKQIMMPSAVRKKIPPEAWSSGPASYPDELEACVHDSPFQRRAQVPGGPPLLPDSRLTV